MSDMIPSLGMGWARAACSAVGKTTDTDGKIRFDYDGRRYEATPVIDWHELAGFFVHKDGKQWQITEVITNPE